MIDKIDKPEPPPPYRVQATTEARGGKQRQSGEEKKDEDEYSASSAQKKWQKFHTEAQNRRAVKLRRKDITSLYLNQVVLQRGLVVIEADIRLINGQILRNSHLFSTKVDTYWKLKKLNRGDEIPVDEFITEDYVEVSILQKQGTQASEPALPEHTDPRVRAAKPKSGFTLWPIVDAATGKTNWFAIVVYITIILAAFIALIVII